MLPAMPPRERPRSRPLAGWSIVATFVMIGVALLATVWSTRGLVIDASDAVRRGQALAIEQAVRADLADLDAVPTPQELAAILEQHADQGLRYIAMVENRGRISAAAGTPVGTTVEEGLGPARYVEEIDGRQRLTLRAFRRMKAGGRSPRFVIEVEPVQAHQLRGAATITLGVGAVAAASLLGVAIVLVRREARRNADERARERERQLAHLGEMSAVLAHEIKNPLASLKGNAQLLAQMLPAGEKPRAKAERVVDEAVRLEQLTNDLLAVRPHRRDPACAGRPRRARARGRDQRARRDRGRDRGCTGDVVARRGRGSARSSSTSSTTRSPPVRRSPRRCAPRARRS